MASEKRFEKLLEPGYIGSVKTRNRIVKTGASTTYFRQDETSMNSTVMAFHEALARGGVGLLIVESPTVDYPYGARWRERGRIDDDKYIAGFRELTDMIHKYGCPTFMQMNHDGPWQSPLQPGTPPLFEGPPVAASAVNLDCPGDFHRDLPRVLTVEEIKEIEEKFISAAVRGRKAGFDGVDINSASSHLGHNFLSPFWNRREDEYGGSLENRARFLLNIVREIKKRAGNDFPISVCINGVESGKVFGIPDSKCLTAQDSRTIIRWLKDAGVDAIHLRSHWIGYHTPGFLTEEFFYPESPIPLKDIPPEYNWKQWGAGANLILAEELKKTLSIPIMVVGRMDPENGEKALHDGRADFIAMTRRLFADPELPNKLAAGRYDEIAPCTACCTCLGGSMGKIMTGGRYCRINAFMGTDKPYVVEKADKKKKVAVIGGGPAGLEAARVAALRGHNVTLYEKSGKLGGLLPLAALVKGLEIEDLPAIVHYLEGQINRLGVKVELGKEVDAVMIEKARPDVVILAVGGIAATPEIPGINKSKVVGGPALHKKLKFYLKFFSPNTLRWLTRFWMPIGKRVVIIGAGVQGCELAEFLVKRGRKVTIADTSENLGEGMARIKMGQLIPWLMKKDVTIMTGLKSMEITDTGLAVTTRQGESRIFPADTIVTALPLVPNNGLMKSLEGKVPEVYAIGDCREPQMIIDAIASGMRTARSI
jgi:2,4-dienoyl-CoA reductase (NADPH2)